MTLTTNVDNLQQYKSDNEFFFHCREQILVFASSANLVREVKDLSQISKEFYNDVLRYKYFSFKLADPHYCKTLISSAKST